VTSQIDISLPTHKSSPIVYPLFTLSFNSFPSLKKGSFFFVKGNCWKINRIISNIFRRGLFYMGKPLRGVLRALRDGFLLAGFYIFGNQRNRRQARVVAAPTRIMPASKLHRSAMAPMKTGEPPTPINIAIPIESDANGPRSCSVVSFEMPKSAAGKKTMLTVA
jgi:hypothetical protein